MTQNVSYRIIEFTRRPGATWMPVDYYGGLPITTDELNESLTQRYKVTENGATFYVGRLPGLASRFFKLKMQTGEIFSIREGWVNE